MASNSLAGAGNRTKFSSAPLKTVQEIQFGIFSPEDVKKMSVVEVLYPEMMVRRWFMVTVMFS
jgi:DNA-directed RNA polymerase II subunit RPB1